MCPNGPVAAIPVINHALMFPSRHGIAKLLRLILLRRTQSRSVRAIAPRPKHS